MRVEALQLHRAQEQFEQQHEALQHGMMTMQDWGHQEVQAYQQLLQSFAQKNQKDDHRERSEPEPHKVPEKIGFSSFSVGTTPRVFGKLPAGTTLRFSVGATPSGTGPIGVTPLCLNQTHGDLIGETPLRDHNSRFSHAPFIQDEGRSAHAKKLS